MSYENSFFAIKNHEIGDNELSIFGSRKGTKSINYPPLSFLRSIKDGTVRLSKRCCFILYSLSEASLITEIAVVRSPAFEIFKECYNRNKKYKCPYNLQDYFDFEDMDRRIQHNVKEEDILEGITLLFESFENEIRGICIFPKILLFDKTTSNLQTLDKVVDYLSQFETALKRQNEKALSHIYTYWLKLIESYVELIFRDLAIKWCQWLHSVRAAKHRRSLQVILKTLLPVVCRKFWSRYFTFYDSVKSPIKSLSSELIKKLLADNKRYTDYQPGITFGLWLDPINGILIMSIGLCRQQAKNADDILIIPINGLCLDQCLSREITKKVFLFINFAIIECFINEAK